MVLLVGTDIEHGLNSNSEKGCKPRSTRLKNSLKSVNQNVGSYEASSHIPAESLIEHFHPGPHLVR